MYQNNTNIPCNQNTYPNYPQPAMMAQPVAAVKKPEDSIYTKRLREHFPFFGLGSALYALFYTFCLYKNASGITYPFFVAGTLCYFFFSMKKLGVPYKKDSAFYIVSIILLGISNCLTGSQPLLIINKLGIFLLSFTLMIHTIYLDRGWNLPKYLGALTEMVGTACACALRPFKDMSCYFDAQKQAKTGKKNYVTPVLAGIAITIPILALMTMLLAGADAVFSDMLSDILYAVNFMTIFKVCFLTVFVFICSYAVISALGMKNIREQTADLRVLEPITAIIVTAALSVLYLTFSMIQILYLFIGNMQLPEGYTYSSYARQGFFQLLTVCVLNLVIVLVCLYFFRENMALKIILTVISGCTFIMILSSALRMLMYIKRYNLTFLRIIVLWALAVIFLLMAGVTVFIYRNSFPLFTYGTVIVTVFYIGLSFAHPDYWIARYNLDPAHIARLNEYDVYDSKRYLCSLSADAAPILLNEKTNPYLRTETADGSGSGNDVLDYSDTAQYTQQDVTEELAWLQRYHDKTEALREDMHIRNFNFSVYTAGRYLDRAARYSSAAPISRITLIPIGIDNKNAQTSDIA